MVDPDALDWLWRWREALKRRQRRVDRKRSSPAHEYAGEAALLVDNLPRAERHLAALEQICLLSCEELDDLRAAVAAYRGRTASGAPGPQEK